MEEPKKISRKEALKMARGTLKTAEQQRLDLREYYDMDTEKKLKKVNEEVISHTTELLATVIMSEDPDEEIKNINNFACDLVNALDKNDEIITVLISKLVSHLGHEIEGVNL